MASIEIDIVELFQVRGPCGPFVEGKVRFTPIQLTGIAGTDSAITINANLQSGGPNPEGSTTNCLYNENAYQTGLALRPGRWMIETAFGAWGTSCNVNLEAGLNNIKFTVNVANCTVGTTTRYPGS